MKVIGILGAIWGAVGMFWMLVSAIWGLAQIAWDAYSGGFTWVHWVVCVLWVIFMAHAEGYKGFQKSFSPRTAARIHYLWTNPKVLHSVLAPFFAMGYFHGTKRTKMVAWILSFGILGLVLLVRLLPQPWRGIIDVGVVVGLTWGTISLAIFVVRAFVRGEPDASPGVPGERPEGA
ncbi:MAG: hypothetical protein AAF591_10935 [Verrucomicrobiota bacterium]